MVRKVLRGVSAALPDDQKMKPFRKALEARLPLLRSIPLLPPRGCHWSGKKADRAGHHQVCLVNRINNWRLYVDELEDAILEYEKRVLDLEIALVKQIGLNDSLQAENETLKEQSELDKAVIESLRSQLASSVASSSMRMGESGRGHDVIINSENTLDESAVEGQNTGLDLLLAAERGDIASMKEMPENMTFMDTSESSHGLGSALHAAAGCGHAHAVEVLLGCGHSDVANALDVEGNSALHVAALNGHEDVVRVLLASAEFRCICLPNVAGRTALHCAPVQGNQEIVKMLLFDDRFTDEAVNAQAEEHMPVSYEEVQVTTEEGVTALHLAAKFGHVGVVQALLEPGRFKALHDKTVHLCFNALHIAARYGHCGVATALLQSGRFNAVNALDVFGSSALHVAAHYGSSAVAKVLLEEPRFTKASHQNSRSKATALHSAALGGHVEVTQLLLMATQFPSSAVNAVDKEGSSALHYAAGLGHCQVMEELLNSNRFTSVNSRNLHGSMAIHAAAFRGQVHALQILLSSSRFTASSLPNSGGQTALHLAAMQGHCEVVKVLLASVRFDDSAVNATTLGAGKTALHLAVQLRHVSVVNLLLLSQRFNAVLRITTWEGHTALHLAVACSDSGDATSLTETLLGSNHFTQEATEAQDKSGRTVLHMLAERGHYAAAQVLQKSGRFTAVAVREDRQQRTALDIASARADTAMISLLRSWSQ